MFVIKNYMEEVVFNQMESILKDVDICKCEKCMKDVAAIVLNSLPSKYVVTEKGALFTKIDALQQQFEIGVTSAILQAAQIVQKRPLHTKSQDVMKA